MAGVQGFEPRMSGSKPGALPLGDTPKMEPGATEMASNHRPPGA